MEFVKNVYTAKVRNSFAPVFFLSFASNINDLGYNWEILIINGHLSIGNSFRRNLPE